MKKPQINDFTLRKVKLLDMGLKVDAIASFEEKDGETLNVHMKDVEFDSHPAPDLTNILEEMKAYFAEMTGHLFVKKLVEREGFKATDSQKKIADKAGKEVLAKINITGLSLKGEGDNKGFVITGTFDGIAMNPKFVKFSSERWGFEADMQRLADELHEEVYLYIYEGKKSQLDLFSANGNNEEMEMGEMALAK